MSDSLQHECGIAMLRLKKPLQHYVDKYGTPFYGLNKMYLLMEKQHNRGQDGAGLANIKLDVNPGKRYISRMRSIDARPIRNLFHKIMWRFQDLTRKNCRMWSPSKTTTPSPNSSWATCDMGPLARMRLKTAILLAPKQLADTQLGGGGQLQPHQRGRVV